MCHHKKSQQISSKEKNKEKKKEKAISFRQSVCYSIKSGSNEKQTQPLTY